MNTASYKLPQCPCGTEMSFLDMDFKNENKSLEIILKCQNCGISEAHDYELTETHRKVVSDE